MAPRACPSLSLWFVRLLLAFGRRELAVISTYRVWFATRALTVGLTAVALVFLARFVGVAPNPHLAPYGGDYLAFGLVGLLTAELQQVGVSALAQRIHLAQIAGTLEAQLATPAPNWLVLLVPPAYELGAAVLRAAAYLAGAVLLLGVRLPHAQTSAALLVALLTLTAFAGLGMLAAAITMLARRANPIAMLIGAASVLLSGVVFPRSVLPSWLQSIGELLPLTHALEGLRRTLLAGSDIAAASGPVLSLAAFTILLVPLGMGAFIHALRRARIDGSLTHY